MRIAFDTGGTFTDCVYVRGGRIEILKIPSTPRNPANAVDSALKQIRRAFGQTAKSELVCGTTVGTNALLQRTGGEVALITTAGFEDVLEIGRQARPQLYNLLFEKAEPLVPSERRLGLRERMRADGRVLISVSPAEITRIVRAVRNSGADSIALCLLFSFANPAHEKLVVRSLKHSGLPISVSHEILPEYREFERTSTTVINAYLVPVMSQYLSEIEQIAAASPSVNARGGSLERGASRRRKAPRVRIMQSNGGILSASTAANEPVRTILSGPAGGVLGAKYVAEKAGFTRVITFDMGGTSTDVALMDGGKENDLPTTSESVVAGMPVAVPMLDIHTVGAGGGSIARFDRAGALRIGPASAGAEPGPICYGRGEKPTVTDANLTLGRIPQTGLLGGSFQLDLPRTLRYLNLTRGPMPSVDAFAQGILDVANSVMEKAIRVISVERGHDPREFTLVAFGGAGGLHACELAQALEVPRVLVPCFPGGLSALGILRADVTKDLSRTIRLEIQKTREAGAHLRRAFAVLKSEGLEQMHAEGFSGRSVQVHFSLDMRYAGQSYELNVPFAGDFIAAFHRAHEKRYGYSDRTRGCEVVNVRARFTGRTPKPDLPAWKSAGRSAAAAIISKAPAHLQGRRQMTNLYDRSRLRAGNRIVGPAIVTEYSATTFLPPEWFGQVDRNGNLILEPRR